MKNRMASIFLSALMTMLLIVPLGTVVSAASTAAFNGEDTTTQGAWIGNYGKDGYWIFDRESSGEDDYRVNYNETPAYASITFEGGINGEQYYDHWPQNPCMKNPEGDTEFDEFHERFARVLQDPKDAADSERWANFNVFVDVMTMDVSISDGSADLSIYFLDYDSLDSRKTQVTVYDADTNAELIAPILVEDYTEGKYVKFTVSGNVRFEFEHIEGDNSVFSALFFDNVSSGATVAPSEEDNASEEDNNSPAAENDSAATEADTSQTSSVPQTGDNSIILWLAVSVTAVAVIVKIKKVKISE